MPDPAVLGSVRRRLALGPSRRLVGVFLLFIFLPGTVLAIIALRVLGQEGQIARQRMREELARTAEEIGRDLDSEFRSWTGLLAAAGAPGELPDPGSFPEDIGSTLAERGGGVLLSDTGGIIESFPSGAILFVPRHLQSAGATSRPRPAGFTAAESLELGRKDYGDAVRAYKSLLASADAESRPLVLQRLARTLRKAGRLEESAQAYRDLLSLETVRIGNLPSDLIARAELCSLAYERGGGHESVGLALDFYGDLVKGVWPLDKPRYLYYSEAARTWCRDTGAAGDDFEKILADEQRKLSLSRAVEDVLAETRMVISGEHDVYLAFQNAAPFRALVLSARTLGSSWWPLLLGKRAENLDAALLAADGTPVFGTPPPEPPPFAVTRDVHLGDTAWLLQIWPLRPEAIHADIRQKQLLYIGMLGLVILLLIFGGYITVRIVRRELEIAQLRADFVSTVSHEFRSPLTGIRQLGGMLLDGRVTDPEKQRGYFRMIVHESDRLSRLVENVLDFSRMEEGRRAYRFEPLDPSPWLRTLAAEFETEASADGVSFQAAIPDGLPRISADKEALGSAVRNLLDNAVKYSSGQKTVRLSAGSDRGSLEISVRDEGIGISEEDQKHVFDRFYRASGEISKRIKGAGLGLSLVFHIVKAHGGEVGCRSRLGEGSTFTLRIPAAPVEEGG